VKRLLRGVIDFGGISPDGLQSNYARLRAFTQRGLEWGRPEDERIFGFIDSFFQNNLALPSAATVKDYFVRSDDIEVQERLDIVAEAEAHTQTNYAHLLGQLLEDQRRIQTQTIFKEAQEIVTKGMVIKDGKKDVRLRGNRDAIEYATRKGWDLLDEDEEIKTAGDIGHEGMESHRDYLDREANPNKAWGVPTGISILDETFHGLRPGRLWVHAGFAGHLKSSFAMSWAYTARTVFRNKAHNVLYVSLEMPYEQVRDLMVLQHTAALQYAARGLDPLDYRKLETGTFTPEERAFHGEAAADWNAITTQFRIWCPDRDVTLDDIRVHAETLEREMHIGLIVIDHAGLVQAKRSNSNYGVEQNSIFRDSKKLALHFRHRGEGEGVGVPVLLLAQINREGLKAAEKEGGILSPRSIAWAHEAERSADILTATYLDDTHRANGTTLMTCLKSRDTAHFPPTTLRVRFGCRRIENPSLEAEDMGVDDDFMLEAM